MEAGGRHRITAASRLVVAVLAMVAIVAAGTAGVAPGAAAAESLDSAQATRAVAEPGTLQWGPCSGVQVPPAAAREAPEAVRLECATLRVPRDYDHPGGRTIEVAVSRLATSRPDDRRGVLLLNPGGPGGSGLVMPLLIAALLPQSVLDSYDLIGFDPRGVGQSTPVTCKLTAGQQRKVLPWPLDGGVEANARVAEQIAGQCQQHSAKLLPHITTANTARDMDRIRAALGEDKISYLGYSYGTYLGAVYSSLFPAHTDRIVLDSSISPIRIWRETLRAWGPANEIRFPDFAEWAAARNGAYQLGDSPGAVRRLYFTLAKELDAHPLETPAGTITDNVFRETTRAAMYGEENFPALAQFWQMIKRSDGAAAAQAARNVRPRDVPAAQSSTATLLGIFCNDAAWPRSVARYKQDVARDSQRYPLVGPMAANIFACAFWPTDWIQQPVDISSTGPANVLIVQNLRDPATPYRGALDMRAALDDRARLVTINEGGHSVYGIEQNPCALNTVTRFLVDGAFPTRDVYCGLATVQKGPTTLSAAEHRQIVAEIRARQFPF